MKPNSISSRKYNKMTVTEPKTNGFKVFWIQYEEQSSDRHQLFAKEHSVRKQDPQYPKDQTLFLLNIPPYVEAKSLQNAFTEVCGPVRSVTYAPKSEQSQNGFKTGYIVFEKESGLDKALMLRQNYVLILESYEKSETGITKWCKQYNDSVYDEKQTKKEIEEYMRDYDQRVAKQSILNSMDSGNTADEDGWVTVSGKKKRGQHALRRTETVIDKVRKKQAKSNAKKQLLNFYTFQIRESKKQNLAELRNKFEQDKAKLQQLKLKRTFKPF